MNLRKVTYTVMGKRGRYDGMVGYAFEHPSHPGRTFVTGRILNRLGDWGQEGDKWVIRDLATGICVLNPAHRRRTRTAAVEMAEAVLYTETPEAIQERIDRRVASVITTILKGGGV